MKKYFISIIIYVVLIATIAVIATLYSGSVKHNKSLKAQVKEQSLIIADQSNTIKELTKIKTYNYQFEIKLDVTDKSKYNIYGRNNAGTIVAPNQKQYELKIDSTSFVNMKIVPEK